MTPARRPGGSSRRDFLRTSAAAAAGVSLWTVGGYSWSQARGQAPNDKIRFACFGVGGKGSSDTDDAGTFGEIVALCDIDENTLNEKASKFLNARKYYDYRTLLEELGDKIDAVTVSTPDHTHAVIAAAAMRMGKHAFVQKPLTWSIEEARYLRELAAEKKLATQMGNQGTAADGLRRGAEILKSGALGTVHTIHCWTNRPVWPQGMKRPQGEKPVPPHIHWNEFVGPAPMRPFNDGYHPFDWRGWLDYGTGALGDMACHTLNVAFMGLDLIDPISAEVVDTSGIVDNESFPVWSVIKLEFAARGDRAPLTLYWYDGGKNLPDSKKFPDELLYGKKRDDSGLLVIGDKGSFYSQNDYGSEYVLLPEENYKEYQAPEPFIPRCKGGHFREFVDGIEGKLTPMSNFDYAGKLTETVLLGVVALRAGAKIEWDAAAMKAKGNPSADAFIRRDYRKGFELRA